MEYVTGKHRRGRALLPCGLNNAAFVSDYNMR